MAGQTGHRARPSLAGRRGKLAQGPTQHNGLSHVACPQAAAKALLVAPLHATPVMSCAHLPCACGPLLTACSNKPHAQQPLVCAVTAGAVTAECSGQARCRAVCRVGPAHPQWARRLRAFGPRRVRPVRPQGAPSCPALGCCGAGQRGAGARIGHGSLAHRRASPALAHEPHPSLVARVQQRCQAVKAACAPRERGGPWPALTA